MAKKNKVKTIAESLENKINYENLLNSKYNEQNFHMQKELLKHQKGLDSKNIDAEHNKEKKK